MKRLILAIAAIAGFSAMVPDAARADYFSLNIGGPSYAVRDYYRPHYREVRYVEPRGHYYKRHRGHRHHAHCDHGGYRYGYREPVVQRVVYREPVNRGWFSFGW
jgi:hypothetical protein